MPRTKVSKSSKRNREAANREEKLREFDSSLESFMSGIEIKGCDQITQFQNMLKNIVERTSVVLLQMPMGEFMQLNIAKFSDLEQDANASQTHNSTQSISNSASNMLMRNSTVTKIMNPNDEGYLTEDSTSGSARGSGITSSTTLAAFTSMTHVSNTQQQQRLRTPGPLSSACARRPRRSRSACGDIATGSALKPKPSAPAAREHSARNKFRTPLALKTKAFSADRLSARDDQLSTSPQSPSTAFMRWPKPGEIVLSKFGSPVVAQVMPDKFANVNIPVKNGVLSLRPKKLSELQTGIIEAIDSETLKQLKTLHDNLNLIMKMADSNSAALQEN